jgi:methyl-accepting chemotaxis protein
MVDEVSSVSKQTAAEASNVSAASEEQVSSLSNATTSIQRVSDLANTLHDNVAQFEVDAGSAPTGSADSGDGPGTDLVTPDPAGNRSRAETDGGSDTGSGPGDDHPEVDG